MNDIFNLNSLIGKLNHLIFLGFCIFLFNSTSYAADLNLTWDPSTSTNVGGYKLYYGQTSKNYTSAVDVGKVTNYTMTGLANGSTYYMALKSYNAAKSIESASYSNEVSTKIAAVTPTTNPVQTTDFTMDKASGTAPLTVTFTPITTGTPTTWRWDFPGSSTPVVINKTGIAQKAIYSKSGVYEIGLTVYRGNSNINISKKITVSAGSSAVVTTPAPPAAVVATENNLVAAYGFEEIGNNIIDMSGNGNHGTITEATRSPAGYYGYAIKFDGINDLLTVNDSASLDLSTGSTLQAWVNPSVDMSNWKTVLLKEQPGNEIYSLYANNPSNIPTTGVTANGSVGSLSGGTKLPPNKWSHVAATYDGKVQRLYVDGKEVASRTQTGLIQQSNNPLRIGGSSVWGAYFNGLIDEVKIYNRALSSTEISQDWTKAVRISNPPKSLVMAAVDTTKLTASPGEAVQGTALAYKAISKTKAVLTGVQVYLASGSSTTELVAGIYRDVNGHPGALLTQGKRTSPLTNSTSTVVVPPITVEAGQSYWVGILGSKGGIKFSMKVGSTIPTEICKTTGLTTLPATWISGIIIPNNGPLSAYGSGY